jgi:histidinol dehydrogenase
MNIERIVWNGRGAAGEAARIRALSTPSTEVEDGAAAIVAQVREGGDEALRELTAQLDATDLSPSEVELRVEAADIERARAEVDPGLVGALEVAARNIESVARAELEASAEADAELPQGQRVSVVSRPVASAGIYAPGGRAPYPSSVLMCCVPARVAGVDRIVVATPPAADGRVQPEVLAACAIAGVHEVYAVGGAQAIAGLAYGTEAIATVDIVVGPGNRWVNAAKRLVFGDVGVDGIAGPTELVVVLDAGADPQHLALDLLAQSEHGPDGLLAAISADPSALASLSGQLEQLAAERPSVDDARVILVAVPDLGTAIELADAIDAADAALAADRVAGCVFFGPGGGAAFGDYAAGSNHVLPTGGSARFGGPLGVGAFRRRTSVVELPDEAIAGLAPRVAALARAEGFDVHGESAEARSTG